MSALSFANRALSLTPIVLAALIALGIGATLATAAPSVGAMSYAASAQVANG